VNGATGGLLEATGGGTLVINTTIDNASGNITANGPASGTLVQVFNATIQGGTLNTLNGGTMATAGTSTLDGSANGTLTISTGSIYTARAPLTAQRRR
jgi:hypothetical protein